MLSFSIRFAGLALVALLLGGCGFQPLYGDRSVNDDLASVEIGRISDRSGQELHNALLDRLNPKGSPARPLYQLLIELDEHLQDLAVRKNESVTRYNLQIVANYVLYSKADGAVLVEGTSRSTTSFNISTEEYSAIVAKQDAGRRGFDLLADDIKLRLALFFRRIRSGTGG